ncbi:amidohydrolase family protein [Maribacter sp. 2308TA10-17]|uniref:amidohydrolase family protein n=1 Tax=Maribacter sp. 2308TA10-17 TaxID=3386276 RepID=UPI0039BD4A9E
MSDNNQNSIVDIHTHIFNLDYLPIEGILRANGIGKILAKVLTKIISAVTGNTDFNREEIRLSFEDENYTQKFMKMRNTELLEDMVLRMPIQVIDDKDTQEALDEFLELNEPTLEKSERFSEKIKLMEPNSEEYKFYSREVMLDFLNATLNKSESNRKAKRSIDFDYIKWFLFMTGNEQKIINILLREYRHIDHFVFHMMDADYLFKKGRPSKMLFSKQIENMEAVIQKYGDRFIGFIPFNPNRKKSLEYISEAFTRGYFKGIKFYPPLGYRPIDDKNAKYKERIDELFKKYGDGTVPFFTHCTPSGFESIPNWSGRNANPIYWEERLKINLNLKVCLGHAGGDAGWFDDFNENDIFPYYNQKFIKDGKEIIECIRPYGKKVYELCTTYKNVYCEVGFLAHNNDPGKLNNFKKRMEYLLSKDSQKNYAFGSKIMYGSDWHILYNEGLEDNYDDAYNAVFNDSNYPNLNKAKSRFFVENAKSYLGIEEAIV